MKIEQMEPTNNTPSMKWKNTTQHIQIPFVEWDGMYDNPTISVNKNTLLTSIRFNKKPTKHHDASFKFTIHEEIFTVNNFNSLEHIPLINISRDSEFAQFPERSLCSNRIRRKTMQGRLHNLKKITV